VWGVRCEEKILADSKNPKSKIRNPKSLTIRNSLKIIRFVYKLKINRNGSFT